MMRYKIFFYMYRFSLTINLRKIYKLEKTDLFKCVV